MKRYIYQVLALVTSFLTGWSLIDFLTVHPLKMSLFLSLTLLGAGPAGGMDLCP